MKKLILLFIALPILFSTTTTFGQKKTNNNTKTATKKTKKAASTRKSTSQTNLPVDAKSLTEEEKAVSVKLLEFLDGADAVFSITKDPYQFNERVLKMNPLLENFVKIVHNGAVKSLIAEISVAYFDVGALYILSYERSTRENWKLLPENVDYLGEIRRRHLKLFIEGNDDLLNLQNISNIYTYAKVWKTAVTDLIK
jgi:hypothetical protein